jgi:hypothetical protein
MSKTGGPGFIREFREFPRIFRGGILTADDGNFQLQPRITRIFADGEAASTLQIGSDILLRLMNAGSSGNCLSKS